MPPIKTMSSQTKVNVEAIRARLKRVTFEQPPTYFLDVGDLNVVFGDPNLGVPYGKIIELSGQSSHGKTALAIDTAAAAQEDGAGVIWVDLENSFDQPVLPNTGCWYTRRGLKCHAGDPKQKVKPAHGFYLLRPYIAVFPGEKEPRLITGPELLQEAELLLRALIKSEAYPKYFLVIDSIAAIETDGEADQELSQRNMHTSMSVPKFMSQLMKRWVARMSSWHCIVFCINQLREKPGGFGDPKYTPGGNAVPFYAHVRCRIRRAGGGKIRSGGKMIGIKGIITNMKNKAGGQEGEQLGYKIYTDGRLVCTDYKEIEKRDKVQE